MTYSGRSSNGTRPRDWRGRRRKAEQATQYSLHSPHQAVLGPRAHPWDRPPGEWKGFRPWPAMSAPLLSSHARLGTRQILPGLLRPHRRGARGGQRGSHMDAETARWEAGRPAVAEGEVAGSECPVQRAHQRTFLLAKASRSRQNLNTHLLWDEWFSFY